MEKKFQLGKEALTLSILTLITALTWIGFEVHRALTRSEIPQVLQEQIAPLNPQIDQETLQILGARETISQEELAEVAPPPVITPTPSPEMTPTPEAELSPTPTPTTTVAPTPTATPGGTEG